MLKSKLYTKMFIFAAALILSAFPAISCSQNDGAHNGNSEASDERTGMDNPAVSENKAENPADRYGDNLGEYDFCGEEFKIHTMDTGGVHYLVDVEEESGDTLNDAIYRRNREIEERFNVAIKQILQTVDYPRKPILAGDSSAFDVFHSLTTNAMDYWTEGLAHSYETIPNIDLSKPYWCQYANDTLTVAGHQYVAIGEFTISAFDLAHMLIFNKDMIKDFSLENPYALVKDGKWTFDKMDEMMKQAISDLNGDGVMDKNDRYGFLSEEREVLPCFWISAGELSVKKDENDIPYLALGEERFLSVFQKVFNITWDNGAYFSAKDHSSTLPQAIRDMFSNAQSLFMNMTFFYMESMRMTEIDFGVMPYPKFDENQKNYVTRVEWYNPIQVPVTNQDLERAGVIIEALNSYSAKYVVSAYYDIALKNKYSRDDESVEMLDLISATRIMDIGDTVLCGYIRDNFMWSMFEKNKRDFVSEIEKTQGVIEKFIDKIPKN